VLSTFIHYPDAEIARLLFHELAHQVAYAPDDSTFNESFAVAVEREGMRRYLAKAPPERKAAFDKASMRREDFAGLVSAARQRLEAAYAGSADDAVRRQAKARIAGELRQAYVELEATKWHGFAGYDGWFATEINNAKLGSVAVYTGRVPAFEALLQQQHWNLAAFYTEVRTLSKMPKARRDAVLDSLSGSIAGRLSEHAANANRRGSAATPVQAAAE
jgi:predicted aminopeptidase